MGLILGIESTCDETAAAIVRGGWDVRSNVIASQINLHQIYRGVVPEIASRAHLENIVPVVRETLEKAGVGLDQLDAIAVAHRPGLVGSLLIGVTAAKSLAWGLDIPMIGVDHVHAHLYSVRLETNLEPAFPAVGLVCSGGHTALYSLNSFLDITLIGSTIDDAVGEAYDKVAAILGLGYPGGPILDSLAAEGNAQAVKFPRSNLSRDSLDFSFSGLKTAVLYHVRGNRGKERGPEGLTKPQVADIAASFQMACIDVLTTKLRRACDRIGARSVIVGGGVSANSGLRRALQTFGLPVHFPKMQYCTDNAAMTGGLAHSFWSEGKVSDLGLDAVTFSRFTE